MLPGVALHIVQRGHNRQNCFRHDTDRLVYLANLLELAGDVRCAVHAYCLMTNHVHLLLTPETQRSCACLMRALGQRYVQYFNRRYERTGTLWEGRPHSCLVESERYVLACYRYIESNPVRAGMAAGPGEYRWSSHAGNAGRAANNLLTAHPEYLALAGDEASRHAAYRGLFAGEEDQAMLASIRDATAGNLALIGEGLKSNLPPEVRRQLTRGKPGPRAQLVPSAVAVTDLELEFGLRPGIN